MRKKDIYVLMMILMVLLVWAAYALYLEYRPVVYQNGVFV